MVGDIFLLTGNDRVRIHVFRAFENPHRDLRVLLGQRTEIPDFSSRSNQENATSRSACFCLYCLLS